MLKLLLGYIREISGTWLPKKGACLAVCVWKKSYEYVDNISNGQEEEMDIFFFFLSEEQINILNEHVFLFLAGLPYILNCLELFFGGGSEKNHSIQK